MEQLTLRLCRNSLCRPWGFRIQGGCDTAYPPIIQRVFSGSPADGILQRGDIVKILDGHDCTLTTQRQILDFIRVSGTIITLTVIRGDAQVSSILEEQGRSRIASRTSFHSVRPSTAHSFMREPVTFSQRGMITSSAPPRELPKAFFQPPTPNDTFSENVFMSPTDTKQSFTSTSHYSPPSNYNRAAKPPPCHYSAMQSPIVQRNSVSTVLIRKTDNNPTWTPLQETSTITKSRNIQHLSKHSSTSMIQLSNGFNDQQPPVMRSHFVTPQYNQPNQVSHNPNQFNSLRRQTSANPPIHSTAYQVHSLNRNADSQLKTSTWHISTLPRNDRSYSMNQLYPMQESQQENTSINTMEHLPNYHHGFSDGLNNCWETPGVVNKSSSRVLKINLYDSGNSSNSESLTSHRVESSSLKRDQIRPAYPAALSRMCSSSSGNYSQLSPQFSDTTNPQVIQKDNVNQFMVKPTAVQAVRQSTTNLFTVPSNQSAGNTSNRTFHPIGSISNELKQTPYRRAVSVSTLNSVGCPTFKIAPSKNSPTMTTPEASSQRFIQHGWTGSSQALPSPVYGSRKKMSQLPGVSSSSGTDF